MMSIINLQNEFPLNSLNILNNSNPIRQKLLISVEVKKREKSQDFNLRMATTKQRKQKQRARTNNARRNKRKKKKTRRNSVDKNFVHGSQCLDLAECYVLHFEPQRV